jgi:hypothetical protein
MAMFQIVPYFISGEENLMGFEAAHQSFARRA